jgi:hypothetical protein
LAKKQRQQNPGSGEVFSFGFARNPLKTVTFRGMPPVQEGFASNVIAMQ